MVENVSYRIGGKVLLDSVDLEIRHGEMLALVGPNGAGKSTLLSVIAGDTQPDSGRVSLDDIPLSDWKLKDLSRRRAMLNQVNTVSFPFSVREVVAMARAPWINTGAEDRDDIAIDTALEATEVAHLQNRTFPTLSGGEKGRVSMSRALAQETSILMLDEPTAAVDLRHQEIVLNLAREAADAGGAVVVVLHDLALAAAYADRVVLLSDGAVRAEGTPEQVLTEDLINEVYQQPVLVHRHPVTGDLLVTPDRRARANGVEHPDAPGTDRGFAVAGLASSPDSENAS
ncbi:heme ABC transporter ATP-binding protein [Dietzia sp. 179-F 9C3 NHS]|uniref:heme ABC transporter ATP-binding protein n=1 Tax=Dietzia sp. 179-F 9C3 NHS TaxID=3374295 RepID=UPI003879D564